MTPRLPQKLLLLVLFGLLAPACHAPPHFMPMPTLFEGVDEAVFTPAISQTRDNAYPVFIASNRLVHDDPEPGHYFTNERSQIVHLAVATLRIGPSDMTWTQLTERSLDDNPKAQTRLKIDFTRVKPFGPLYTTAPLRNYLLDRSLQDIDVTDPAPAEAFAKQLNHQIAASDGHDLFIYVHGYNTRLPNNLALSAGMTHYLARRGALLLFDWPSQANLLGYTADKANAAYSTRHFRQLLVWLAESTDARNIHILAHSAGNPVVVHALRDLRMMHAINSPDELQTRYRIGRVVLAAPDMDLWEFYNAGLDRFQDVPQQTLIYASSRDRALGLSSWIFGNERLGLLHMDNLAEVEHLQQDRMYAVDVSNAQQHHRTFLGHSYFWENPWVSGDLLAFWTTGMPPQQRGLVPLLNDVIWGFPDDYPEQLGPAREAFFD